MANNSSTDQPQVTTSDLTEGMMAGSAETADAAGGAPPSEAPAAADHNTAISCESIIGDHRVALIGTGVMGTTILSGLMRAGCSSDRVIVADRRTGRADELTEKYGIASMPARDAVKDVDTVLIVVKPQDIEGLLEEIGPHLTSDQLIVSMVAGVSTASIEKHLPKGTAVVRVMPNTPALVDQGVAAISGGLFSEPEHLDRVEALLHHTSLVVRIAENQQDAVTAVSGSGPAYVFYVVEAMIEAGVLLGLPRAVAKQLVTQTLFGAATMIKETGEHPTVLREQVSSPAGTTISAVRVLDDHGVRAAFLTAMEAARNRSGELSGRQT